MRKLLLALGLLFATAIPSAAQNTTCATRPINDDTNACASTAFVINQIGSAAALSLPSATTSQLYGGSGTAGAALVVTLGTHFSLTGEVLSADATGTGILATKGDINVALPSATTSQLYGGTGSAGAAADITLGTNLSISSGVLNATGGIAIANASGSAQNTIGAIFVSSTALTLAAAQDFVNGEGIRINHAGAAFTRGAPSALSITPTGTTGSTHYTYTVASLDVSGGVGPTIASVTTTTGNATLSTTNYNALSWTAGSGSPAAYAIYGHTAACTATTCTLLIIVPGGATSWNDTGLIAMTPPDWLPAAGQASALADWLVTTISAGGGTTSLTLAASSTTAASGVSVLHDDTAAMQAALTTYAAGGTLNIPCGNYSITSRLISTIPASKSMKVQGGGQDCAVLNFINGAGTLINYASVSSSSTWSDLTFQTSMPGLGAGLQFFAESFTTLPGFGPASSINNVTFRGADAYGINTTSLGSDYWGVGFYDQAVSQISFYNDNFVGDNGQHAEGVSLSGLYPTCGGISANCYGELYNFVSCNSINENIWINYGEYVQGVSISNSNAVNLYPGGYAVYVPNSTGDDELEVTASQFGQAIINVGSLSSFMSTGSLYIVAANSEGILVAGTSFALTGNTFAGNSPTNNQGIYCASGGVYGTIVGNTFNNLANGSYLASGCNNNNVQANSYTSNVATQVNNNGTSNSVGVATK